ncbi:MAG TPA: ComF family protein [Candidatus Faecousia excrementipullorum]|nr:ComF family protein [Candidatus Faecousia excrementipullorum]
MAKWEKLKLLLFPPKCVLCGKLLGKEETDLCHTCRVEAPEFPRAKISFSFLAGWTAVWYYSGYVRTSLLRYKFCNVRSHAQCYGRLLAMKLLTQGWDRPDILTWIPISARRKSRRGFDQVELIGRVVARELELPLTPALKKIRHTPPQSRISGAAARRANVLGAYQAVNPEAIRGKTIWLLDDILTTGATASEAARTLLTAGAKQVYCAVVAAANHENFKNSR